MKLGTLMISQFLAVALMSMSVPSLVRGSALGQDRGTNSTTPSEPEKPSHEEQERVGAQAVPEIAEASATGVLQPQEGYRNLTAEHLNSIEIADPTTKRLLACLALYFLKITKEIDTWSMLKQTNNKSEKAKRKNKLKALIIGECNQTLPDSLVSKVNLHDIHR
jgi:hypothetical protein